jgi:filamentous hemagglutinin
VFQTSAAAAKGVPENKHRITVTGRLGESITIIPDATIGGLTGTLVEFKNVINITDSKQFRGYAATKQPIVLVVSERTEKISDAVVSMVKKSGGKIEIFDQTTGKFSDWK